MLYQFAESLMSDTHSLPLYIQISEMLIREIQSGRLSDGARLPPEREMAADLKISVGTLRKALAVLTEKHLIERRHGSGNYIRQGTGREGLYAFFRLELLGGGGLPTAQVLSVHSMGKPKDLPRFGASNRAHRIRRLRRLKRDTGGRRRNLAGCGIYPSADSAGLVGVFVLFLQNQTESLGPTD